MSGDAGVPAKPHSGANIKFHSEAATSGTAGVPPVAKSRFNISARGFIGLVAAHTVLLIVDRLVAYHTDISKLNTILPDVEIIVICVIAWVVGLVWGLVPQLCSRRQKMDTTSAKRPPSQGRARTSPDRSLQPRLHAPQPKRTWARIPEPVRDSQPGIGLDEWLQEIDRAASTKDVDAAEEALRGMRRAGFVPQAAVYNSVARTCARAGSLSRAERWLEYISLVGVEVDAETFTALADGYTEAGDPDSAKQCVQRMQEAGIAAKTET